MLKEHRLIGYTLDQLNKQRKDAGFSSVSTPVSSRQVHDQGLIQKSEAGVNPALEKNLQIHEKNKFAAQKVISELSPGAADGTLDADQQAQLNDAYGKLTTADRYVSAIQQQMQPKVDPQVVAAAKSREAERVGLPSKSQAAPGSTGNNAGLSKPTNGGSGVIEQSRQLRQQGFETTVNDQGQVVAGKNSGKSASTAQIQQNQQNLKNIMELGFGASEEEKAAARPIERIFNEQGTLNATDLVAMGITSYQDLLGHGIESIDGADYINVPGMGYVRVATDIKDQLEKRTQQRQQEMDQAKNDAQGSDITAQTGDTMTGSTSNVNPQTGLPDRPSASFSSMISMLPPELQQQWNALGPDFSSWADTQLAGKDPSSPDFGDSMDSITKTGLGMIQGFFDQMTDMGKQQESALKSEQQRLDEIAKQTRDREKRDNDLAQRESDAQYDRLIRDQEIQNIQDEQDWMTSSGITGAWKSTRHSADIIRALQTGKNHLADIRQDKIFSIEKFANKAYDIEENYLSGVKEDAAAYRMASLQVKDAIRREGNEYAKTVYSTVKDSVDAKARIKEKAIEEIGKLSKDYADRAWDRTKFLTTETRLARAEVRQAQATVSSETLTGIGQGLNKEKDWVAMINRRRESVGLEAIPDGLITDEQRKAIADKDSGTRLLDRHEQNGVDYGGIAARVIPTTPGGERNKGAEDLLFGLLEQGRFGEFTPTAIKLGMETTKFDVSRGDYQKSIKSLGDVAPALQAAYQVKGNQNIYNTWKNQTLAKYLAANQSPEWVNLTQNMQMAVQGYIHSNFGTAVTGTEKSFLELQVPSAKDTISTVVQKLNNFKEFMNQRVETSVGIVLGLNAANGEKYDHALGIIYSDKDLKKSTQNEHINPTQSSGSDFEGLENTTRDGSSLPNLQSNSSSSPVSRIAYNGDFDKWISSTGNGKITAGYDSKHNALTKANTHGGVDIDGKIGDPITPAVAGKVFAISGSNKDTSGWGLSMVVYDPVDDIYWRYSHLDDIPDWIQQSLDNGEQPRILPGEMIAHMGKSGSVIAGASDGSHLDVRARKEGGEWIDLQKYFRENSIS